MMFARPMAMDQFDFLSVGFVERGIVEDQQATSAVDKLLGLAPEWDGVGFEALQQASQRVVGSTARSLWLHTRGFGTRHYLRRGN